jgi:hypothetical protein
MNETWIKIKFWLKISFFGILGLIIIIVLSRNWDTRVAVVDLLFVKYENPRLLVVLFFTGVCSIFGWWLFWTVFKTFRQVREARVRGRTEKLERDMADMKAKAAMLQTRPTTAPSTPGVTVQVDKLGD